MKLYELIFSDPEKGFVRRYERNKRDVAAYIEANVEPLGLRELLTEKRIDIPTDKSSFVDWLNENATRVP